MLEANEIGSKRSQSIKVCRKTCLEHVSGADKYLYIISNLTVYSYSLILLRL